MRKMTLTEFVGVVFVYMTIINFVMKKVGGAKLKELEKQIKGLMPKARKGDEEALDRLNEVNSKRLKLSMKAQMYLLPIVLPAIWFIKRRYAELQWTVFGHTFGWLASFIILGIPANIVADKLVKRLLNYS